MREPIAIIFNDVHLKTGNEKETLESFKYMVDYANKNQIERVIFAGDLFDSRSFQRQEVLLTFDTMLSLLGENNIELDIIPGNHDKTLYASYDSFLDIFSHYPNVNLWRDISDIYIDGVTITLLPFFSDDMLIPKLEEHVGGDVLISHFEMAGSTHLGRTSEKKSINKKLLSKWRKTYLGHYHNHHEITKDIVHLPSFRPQSFGEDNNKGFSILYDDLTYKVIKGRFKEFNKVKIDLNTISPIDIEQLIKTHENSLNTIRFEFVGDDSKLKALDKSRFKDTGIDVKLKYKAKYDFEDDNIVIPRPITKYDKVQIKDIFKKFCEDKGYDFKKGEMLLSEFLNK